MTRELQKLLEVLEQGGELPKESLELIDAANRALDFLVELPQGAAMSQPMREAALLLSNALVKNGWRAKS